MNPFEGCRPHKWRRDTTWWDELTVPSNIKRDAAKVGEWLAINSPEPAEHDFILYTDGAGGPAGWGATAAVIQPISYDKETDSRIPQEAFCIFSGSYGSTVQRQELTAFLDGIHAILTRQAIMIADGLMESSASAYELSKQGPLAGLLGPDRVTVMWYTDRANLALSLLFDEAGEALNARSTERDLWLRWSAMARHVCVTPQWTARNLVDGQAACDTICTVSRALLKDNVDKLSEASKNIINSETWKNPIHQRALF